MPRGETVVVYHPIEERVLKKVDYVKNETTYYFSKEFVRVVNESGEYNYTYVYHNGQLVAEEVNGVKKFYHTDHLGSSTVVTDASGNVLENTTYEPFGSVVSGGSVASRAYEGKEFDTTIGQYDFHFRGYKSDWGMFTQPDTLIQNVYDPQSLNRYAFERNNPYKYVDPSGHFKTPAQITNEQFVGGGSYIVNEILTFLVFGQEISKYEEEQLYEELYDEVKEFNPDLPKNSHKEVLIVGKHGAKGQHLYEMVPRTNIIWLQQQIEANNAKLDSQQDVKSSGGSSRRRGEVNLLEDGFRDYVESNPDMTAGEIFSSWNEQNDEEDS
ncbi:RHS repeat domain-containing protein [Bacteroidota bacterium]